LLRAAAAYDHRDVTAFRRARVTRTKFLGPVRIVGIESADRDELITGLNTGRGGGALRDYLSHM